MKTIMLLLCLCTACTPEEAIIVEEVVHVGIEAEQDIQEAISKPRAPTERRKRIDDRTAPVQMKKERHDDVTRPK